VYTGDRVQVGTVWTVATECIVEPISASVAHSGGPTTVAFGGVKYLTVEPLTAAVSTGATVTVDQRAYARELEAGFRNSQYGLSVNNSRVTNCDISAVRSAGQFGAWIKGGAVVDFVGGLPATVGRSVLTDATVRVEDATTLALFRGVNIPYNPNVSVQIQLPTTPGRIVLDGCRVENVTALHTVAESGTPWSRVRMSNSFTAAGDPIKHGPFAVTPIVQTGGSATGIAVSASSSFLHANSANRYTLEIDVTLGTVSGPTSGTLTVLNDAGGTDWPAPNQATFGTAIVLASGVSIPSHILCSMATDKTITVYQQGTTALTALTDANIATGTRLKLLVSYLAA
jgi:hypothetical protein